MASTAAPSWSVRYSQIEEFLSKRVRFSPGAKQQHAATRDAVLKHLDSKIRDAQRAYTKEQCSYSNYATGGSHYNHLAAKGKQLDFDLLFVLRDVTLSQETIDCFFEKHEGASLTMSGEPCIPEFYLRLLHDCAASYRVGKTNRDAIHISCPSVSMTSAAVDFDLLPALQVVDAATGQRVSGLYLIPASSDRWKLSFTGREKCRILEMNEHLGGLRDAIRIMKYINQEEEWGLPSFAFTCLAWHAEEQLRIYKWPHPTLGVSWDKVRILHALLLKALQEECLMHMFYPKDNLLSSVNIEQAHAKVSACRI